MKPGEYLLDETRGDLVANPNRRTAKLLVKHRGDRPIQIGSHYHFFEVNRALIFNRRATYGMRLNIPAGTAVRFEPGQTRTVQLVAYSGDRVVQGFRGEVMGPLDAAKGTP